ncbi:probable ATP-dependent RNA helicase DDX10 [Polyodon spathula]|uniref:probable ATP-dependent RNA helicase DDX10 n=1 Tax=Polyodon spathula TaxID=7913 RepID=UPI001B7E0CAD|nr:probable ATP-dependent RNA helicase DDX10 [Polyodon spathula]
MTGVSGGKTPGGPKPKKRGRNPRDTDDPVKNFERWKKKYNKKKIRVKQEKRRSKKPEWQIERETISKLVKRYQEINPNEAVKFSDFPLSKKTLKGLWEAQYRLPTEIQKQTIGLALQGKDVLGAAKTGSGKTLAFLIPVLECLFRQQWTADDGLGALIISPTRELAYQTFEVLRKVGKNHEFSAGLIIGGKDLKSETERIHRTNIIICTPGRLLQHMDETMSFHASNLHILVLDEADRILDMGFADTVNAIVENLPKTRQTLLFSATQTKSVKDLARLSLKDPEYVWVHEKAKFSTPATLEQNYVVCELHQKVNMLFSFMKSHLNRKVIVFFSSCKESPRAVAQTPFELPAASLGMPIRTSRSARHWHKFAQEPVTLLVYWLMCVFFVVFFLYYLQQSDEKLPQKKKVEKDSKFKAAKKALKRNFIVNTKITFTEDGEMVQQWPPVQRLAVKDEDGEDANAGIDVQKARERLFEEDKFDKEEYRRRIKEKHRERRLKEKAARREASKRQKEGASDEGEEEEVVAYLDQSDNEGEFDPSTLPDPDKHRDSDQDEESSAGEDVITSSKKRVRKRSHGSESSSPDEEEMPAGGKKRKSHDHASLLKPLDTGLSLAEDEELVLHLLGSRS